MSLTTFSSFYFGHTITATNQNLDFKEGAGPELTAILNIGEYSLTDFVSELKRALDVAGALTYTVSVNRTTRFITISTTSTFSLLVSSGSHFGTSVFTLAGFTGADRTGSSSYVGNLASGSIYEPQYKLQDHISSNDWQQAAESTVNKTASGSVEVVSFGTEKFIQANIKYSTNRITDNVIILNDATGVIKLETFMQYIITKAPIEYMADKNTPTTFQTVLLETTPDSDKGTGYKLKEMYDRGLPGFFETGSLKFRVIE